MKPIIIVIPGFDQAKIQETVEKKREDVVGESFIVDWGDKEYREVKDAFAKATASMDRFFGPSFVPQINHHSTIVSKRLDRIDRGKGATSPKWLDPDYCCSGRIFGEYLRSFVLQLDSCVCAPGGTIQLVYRNELELPKIRQGLIGLGAEVKCGTLAGDRLNTCTVVLGHLKCVPPCVPTQAIAPRSIKVSGASLVRYFDIALNKCETLQQFSRAKRLIKRGRRETDAKAH